MPCHGTMIGAISAFYMCIADFKDGKKCWSIQGYTLVTWWKRASSQVNCPEYARILLQTLFFFTQGWSIMVNLIWYSNWDSFGNLLWMNWLKQGNRSLKNPFHPWRWKSPYGNFFSHFLNVKKRHFKRYIAPYASSDNQFCRDPNFQIF